MRESRAVGEFKLYHYSPSKAAAIVMIVLFAISTLFHTYQLFRKRTWYFIPFVIGGIFETIGYVGRALSANETPNWSLVPYVMQSLLILLAPTLFAASIYMVLGRIIRLVDGENHSLIRVSRLTKIFVGGDVLSFLAQSGGAGILSNAKTTSSVNLGQNVITAGLGIQVLFFGLFVVVAMVFHLRIQKSPTTRSSSATIPWERHLIVLYTACLLILVRSVFRIIEYVMGQDGVLLSHEIYVYIFDATLMFLAMIVFNVCHPGAIITKDTMGSIGDVDVYGDNFEELQPVTTQYKG
ncbi:hypothetical protein VE04_01650 [Pseudogymnoascus sp. 24MN13]|nr:hypothetical protein VE04_01650 [Pseudogymnoascus sp. 24MN13]